MVSCLEMLALVLEKEAWVFIKNNGTDCIICSLLATDYITYIFMLSLFSEMATRVICFNYLHMC